ncbi:NADPH-dependent FMN reductase [Levilactobacillus bambusae]|uniref:NADPH-dependent FMN reductase n=1 Tax=Levilactobacillus bambusae TaxID=2024736 RepID=A0A2V1MZ47_9LACO|nr:NADPH-dependent FMN reductase [Levilactobacillus bambusae]PWG00291.1 NADPH-dependent FMN reductase [Levilactobacillus bambusae]
MTSILVLLGSIRTVSNGEHLYRYLANNADRYTDLTHTEFQFKNLRDYQLTGFDEPLPPLANKNRQLAPNTKRWLADLGAADGYLIMTPEYDHTMPGALKNALDYVADEFMGKPAKVLTYANNSRGGRLGGIGLLAPLSRLGAFTLPAQIAVPNVDQYFNESGVLDVSSDGADAVVRHLDKAIRELAFYTELLKNHPFN